MRVYVARTKAVLEPTVPEAREKHVLWGDWLDVAETDPPSDDWLVGWKVWNAATNAVTVEPYLIEKSACQPDALLEMIFLDVGQGDGCIVSVPEEGGQRTLLIDAGQYANMHGFLKWRFRYVDSDARFHAAVITHPDQDHYLGFQSIFEDRRIHFAHIYHNGLVERVADDREDGLGPREEGFLTQLFPTRDDLRAFLSDPARRGRKLYPKLLWTALGDPERFGDVSMASTLTGDERDGRTYLPGFAPDGVAPTIEVLGPVPEPDADGRLRLRAFGKEPGDGGFDPGKTKNGHSVLLKLCYGGFRVIFGGDLNRPAEDYLLRHYGGIDERRPLADAVPGASERFGADLLKVCHHGSADVTDEFLQAVRPFAFVLSSGDEESHVHPRPEILGLLGKQGRGARPLVLCTEILRSTPGSRSPSAAERAEQERLLEELALAPDAATRRAARTALNEFVDRQFRRLVNVYGAINVRTDGEKLIVAFRKERAGAGSPWQVYEYRLEAGDWVAVSAAGDH